MRDEELAEEYANTVKCEWENDTYWVDCRDEVEDAFLAGLKAKPQWHILEEEPNTLPKEGQKVKVLTEEGQIEESTYYYDTYYEDFEWSNIGLLKVFAWKELPKER